jgi:cytidine deaminase
MEDGKGPHGSVGRIIKYDRLTSLQQQALEQALTVLDNAYNPYSGFSVGATLISADGRLITGTNFENAAYGSTICAERAAVLQANSMGVRHFTGIAIIARGKNRKATNKVTAPCGSCRQVLWELARPLGWNSRRRSFHNRKRYDYPNVDTRNIPSSVWPKSDVRKERHFAIPEDQPTTDIG